MVSKDHGCTRQMDRSEPITQCLFERCVRQKLSDVYINGWKAGLKTFYYLRTLGATQIEKSTLDAKKFGYTQKREYTSMNEQQPEPASVVDTVEMQLQDQDANAKTSCSISADPGCEVCQ